MAGERCGWVRRIRSRRQRNVPFGHVLQPPAAAQPGGADVAPQPLQALLQGRRGVLNEGAELGQGRRTRLRDDTINGSWVA